jgi:hypothetical protein
MPNNLALFRFVDYDTNSFLIAEPARLGSDIVDQLFIAPPQPALFAENLVHEFFVCCAFGQVCSLVLKYRAPRDTPAAIPELG